MVERHIYQAVEWETNLTVPEGARGVKSGILVFKHPYVTKWQVELIPNLVDDQGTRYLSFWVRLVESKKENVDAGFNVALVTTPEDDDYIREADTRSYSKENPCYGYSKFIEMYRIESKANPRGDRFVFRFQLQIFEPTPPQWGIPADQVVKVFYHEYEAPVTLDGTLVWNGIELFVDSRRLLKYSIVLGRRMKRSFNLTVDVTRFFKTKCMIEAVIKFVHNDGVLVPCPKRTQGIRKLMKLAMILGMPTLRLACHHQFIKKLQPKYFSNAVRLVNEGILTEEIAMPLLVELLMSNCRKVMRRDRKFNRTYQNNLDLFNYYGRKYEHAKRKAEAEKRRKAEAEERMKRRVTLRAKRKRSTASVSVVEIWND